MTYSAWDGLLSTNPHPFPLAMPPAAITAPKPPKPPKHKHPKH